MKSALKEYKDMVLKPSFKWVKKHWKGYLVFTAICMGNIFWWEFIDRIKNVFRKERES